MGSGVEAFRNAAGSISEDGSQILSDKQSVDQSATEDSIREAVPHHCPTVGLLENVLVVPESIRPLKLFVHKPVRRIPGRDACAPAQRDAVNPEAVVDQRACPHDDGQRCCDVKNQPGRRDRLQVGGI
jgi:hypothetical protein